MKKYFLLLIPILLLSRSNPHEEICDNVKLVTQEAKMIYEKFNDPTNALNLLNSSVFRNITFRKPDCMTKNEYLNYLGTHSLYMSETKNNHSFKMIENYVKKYPEYLYFQYMLGKSYENQYVKFKNQDYREKALIVYRKYIDNAKLQNVKVEKHILDFVKTGGLVKSKSSWGKYLNPSGEAPLGKFKAVYIDTHEPKKIVASEIVEQIGVNYPYNKFHNIKSSNFGGYWVGSLKVEKETKKMIYVSQSNATTRVIIDGYVVYDGSYQGGVPFTFTKGVHKIEVEHLNRWHTTELNIKIIDKVEKYTIPKIKEKLTPVVGKRTEFVYVGVYESEKKDSKITLKVQKSKSPIVLLLQSYSAVTWVLDNYVKTDIQAIIINSHSPEATIQGDIQNIPVLYSKSPLGHGYTSGLPTKRTGNCTCLSGHYTCGSSGGFRAGMIPQEFAKIIRGFSGKYAASILAVPQLRMSDEKYKEIESYKNKITRMRSECTKNKTLTPDELFK
jgi:hypothetical protein